MTTLWRKREYMGGLQQHFTVGPPPAVLFIENRTDGQWVIVERKPSIVRWNKQYAPIHVAGPFPTLDAAKSAYRIMIAARKK